MLELYANSKNPCLKSVTSDLQMLMRRIDLLKTDYFRSSNRVFDFHDQTYGFGGGLQLVTVYGDAVINGSSGDVESRAPLIISARAINYRISKYRRIHWRSYFVWKVK